MITTPAATVERLSATEPVISNIRKAATYIGRMPASHAPDHGLLADFDKAIDQHCTRVAGLPSDNGFVHRTHEAAKRVLGI
ncbi:hypothetical protein [Arthrobacter sp. IK3]|uniref:hypothetical protein n=1 Tax=Arthrobacter sp. IK3 TaxID=3448169 RepID=UPI003EE3725B